VRSNAAENLIAPVERKRLLRVARSAVCEYVMHQRLPEAAAGTAQPRRGAFATLRIARRLRGCMGRPESGEPLETLVAVCAVLAASRDPRFPPVRAEEIAALEIELSILSSPQRVEAAAAIEGIVPGVHGLTVSLRGARGLLLPQVATEQGWGAERFLQETCRKAGLPGNAWRDPEVSIEMFSAEFFSESEEGAGEPGG
jgi:AmmeMemoRadiSam system protein A